MKRLLIVAGSVLIVGLVLAIVVLRVVGLDPKERRLYDRTLSVVTDAGELQAVLQSKQKKYARQRVSDKSTVYVFAVSP